jgi:hypothetical protein
VILRAEAHRGSRWIRARIGNGHYRGRTGGRGNHAIPAGRAIGGVERGAVLAQPGIKRTAIAIICIHSETGRGSH